MQSISDPDLSDDQFNNMLFSIQRFSFFFFFL